ncbi:hypothetical protein Smp_017290.3 [Schistosoma mansoni]|uniref:hypothetical protein n=1 Tax=Schistosoma mansoni TaxID=6183 RepID=UPI00022DC562|nr:hypothetical protein Smp_017290.3 [Schistosoma mansoni]|eukprot:XP_018650650.1 hypothetical protein Smp_017290.3 [Schistosoma mansoni]
MDILLYPVVIAVVVCFVTVILYWLSVRKRLKNVLFIGACDSGKTTLFSSIVYGNPSSTFTSLNENVGNLQIDKKALVLVDVPGHDKVRNEIIHKYKLETLALVFVIDSKSIQSDVKDVAEFLYNILVDKVFIKNRVKLLVACNKQDATTAKGVSVVTHLLEKECLESCDKDDRKSRAEFHLSPMDVVRQFIHIKLHLSCLGILLRLHVLVRLLASISPPYQH